MALRELYEIIKISHLTVGRLKEALTSVRQSIEVERALFGISSPGSPFMLRAEFRLITVLLALRSECMDETKTVFNRVCCPPFGLYSRTEFLTLSKRYIAVNDHCSMVQLLDDSKANCIGVASSSVSPSNSGAKKTRKSRKGKR